METGDDGGDIAESVAISLLIAVVATALVYLELWNGSIPAFDASAVAMGVAAGLAAGGAFYYRGTRSTPLDDVPPLAVFLALALIVYVLYPEGLPAFVELALLVGLWTDTALRAVRKHV